MLTPGVIVFGVIVLFIALLRARERERANPNSVRITRATLRGCWPGIVGTILMVVIAAGWALLDWWAKH